MVAPASARETSSLDAADLLLAALGVVATGI
jgi:hypothetical protein